MKTEQDFVGIHCKACGEGSLQLRDKDQSITHKGIDLVISIKIPTCTICGASLLPKYLRQEVKEKAKAMYKARMENNEIDSSLNYNITVKALVHNSFQEKVSLIVPTDKIEGLGGKLLNITYNELINSFNKVFSLLDAPNFVISKRKFIASYVINDLKIKNEIDAALLYEHVRDFFPSEMATHVDYMAINPFNSRQVKAEEKKNKKIIYRIFRDKNDLNRYITYDCLLFNSTLENKLSQYTPVLSKVEMPHAIYYYVTADEITNNKKPIGITIDEIHLLGVKWNELDTDYLLTRVNNESNVLYVHI